jgi:hypothetical protein
MTDTWLVFIHKHRFHRRDAKYAEKFFNKTIKHLALSAALRWVYSITYLSLKLGHTAHAVRITGPTPADSIEVAPAPGCETVCRREKVRPGTGRETGLGHAAVEPTGRYLRRVLQPGADAAILCTR